MLVDDEFNNCNIIANDDGVSCQNLELVDSDYSSFGEFNEEQPELPDVSFLPDEAIGSLHELDFN